MLTLLDKAVAVTFLSRLKCTNVIENLNDHKRSNSYSLNIKLVLDTMASGIDPSNMSQLLSFLDIPQCKLLHERFFRIIELTIGYYLRKIAIYTMKEVIDEEVRLTVEDSEKYKQYKEGKLRVGITVSIDMGWNKRSCDNHYDCLSGHALIIYCLLEQIVAAIVSSKRCRVCNLAEENGEEPPDHVCPKNYDSISKVMEVDAAHHLYKRLYNS